MDEDPARSCIKKPDASVVLAARAVKEGRAFGFYSPGNTGAAVAASILHIGLLPGIKRPVIAAPLPSIKGSVLLLDAGACVDAPADYYPYFAKLGSVFVQKVYNVPEPRVGLLNMGSEANKGPTLMKKAHKALSEQCAAFIGNIEGMEIPVHRADVVVCDGFVGNIVLKLSEGFGSQMVKIVRHRMKKNQSGNRKERNKNSRAEGDIHRRMRRLTDSERYGGAPLLGINGIAVIGHGKARSEAVFNGIRAALRFHKIGLLDGMREGFPPESLKK